jgi:hypothetical protein
VTLVLGQGAADAIVELLDVLELDSYTLLGEGAYGANLATRVAIARPEMVNRSLSKIALLFS